MIITAVIGGGGRHLLLLLNLPPLFGLAIHIPLPSPNRIGMTCRASWSNVGVPSHDGYSKGDNCDEGNAQAQAEGESDGQEGDTPRT